MGSEGVLLGQVKGEPETGLLAVEKPVSKLVLTFKVPGSVVLEMAIEGTVIAAQLYAVAARLARIDRRQFTATQAALPDDAPDLSQLVFTFADGESSEFEMAVGGGVTVGQLDVAERWLGWKANTDFAISFQASMQQAARNQQLMGQLGQRGLGRMH